MKSKVATLALAFCAIVATSVPAQTLQRTIFTEKGEEKDDSSPHPLTWWTENPLRNDIEGDLLLDATASDGKPITARDYRTEVKVLPVGELAGRKILEIRTVIHPGPRVLAAGGQDPNQQPVEWKDLLVATEGGRFLRIYGIHPDESGMIHLHSAKIFGTGPDAFFGTFDPGTGNGGGCEDGYWWVDEKGPHDVNFAPLTQAISRAIPANGNYTPNCWALHPETMELTSWVQRSNAECHACGGLGEVHAVFRIEHGVAKPVSVEFKPDQQ
jgi:hypothetical protein